MFSICSNHWIIVIQDEFKMTPVITVKKNAFHLTLQGHPDFLILNSNSCTFIFRINGDPCCKMAVHFYGGILDKVCRKKKGKGGTSILYIRQEQ